MSPDPRGVPVLPAEEARAVPAARFDLPLGTSPVPEKLVAEARRTAEAQGYAAGWAEGKRRAADANKEAAERAEAFAQRAAADWSSLLEQAVQAIAAAAAGLEKRAAQPAAEAEEALVAAAFALAEALVGHDVAASRSPGEDAIRRALALAPHDRPVRVRMHPAAYAMITTGVTSNSGGARKRTGRGRDRSALGERIVDGRRITVVPDPMLGPGDAIAECDATTIDARLGSALDRVRELLGLPPAAGPVRK
jgi:flagellar assembly protein FliH